MADIDNGQDVLDVSDICDRVEELEAKVEEQTALDDEDADELMTLCTLLAQMKGYGGDNEWRGDWYPGALIRRSYFVEYCEELVKDIGDLPRDLPGYLAIDWQATADNLEVDYSSVDYDGVEYLYR